MQHQNPFDNPPELIPNLPNMTNVDLIELERHRRLAAAHNDIADFIAEPTKEHHVRAERARKLIAASAVLGHALKLMADGKSLAEIGKTP